MKGFILPSFKVMSFAYGPLHTKDIAYVSMHRLVAALDFENISESTGRVNDISRCKTDATFVSPHGSLSSNNLKRVPFRSIPHPTRILDNQWYVPPDCWHGGTS